MALGWLYLASLVAVATTAYPKCPPGEWEGQTFGHVITDGQPVSAASVKGNITYSYQQQMEYFESLTTISTKAAIRTKMWRDWNKLLEFELDVEMNTCQISRELSGAMRRGCIGSGEVTHLKSFMIGDQMADLLKTSDVGLETVYLTVLRDSMVPVTLIASGQYKGNSQYVAFQYANVQSGIKDYHLLSLPKPCQDLVNKMVHQQLHHTRKQGD